MLDRIAPARGGAGDTRSRLRTLEGLDPLAQLRGHGVRLRVQAVEGSPPRAFSGDVLPLDFAAAVSLDGNLPLLRWARANRCPWGPNVIAAAASGGHLDLIEWASENGCPMFGDACYHAAKGGHLGTLRWLREKGCPWTATDLDFLVGPSKGGHLHVIQWAIANGCPMTGGELNRAACNGHVRVLEWAHAERKRCKGVEHVMDEEVYWLAARRGQIGAMRWAKEKGIPLDKQCCNEAARAGQLEALRWLRESGCPWSRREVCLYAAAGAISTSSSGPRRTGRTEGSRRSLAARQRGGIWRCSCGPSRTDGPCRLTVAAAYWPRRGATSTASSG